MYTHYVNMLCACYRDIASAFPAQNTREHVWDLMTIVKRSDREGVAFLTKTLPAFGKAIDLALANGTPLLVSNFGRRKDTSLPKFMGWLLEELFSVDGQPLEVPPYDVGAAQRKGRALSYLRQISFLFYKLEMPYDQQSINRVLRDFVETDAEVGNFSVIGDHWTLRVLDLASSLIKRVLAGVNAQDIIPKHGPGSVASGEKSPQKPYFTRDYVEATRLYPLDSHFYYNSSHVERCLKNGVLMTRDSRGSLRPWRTMENSTAKVVLVPKDSRGPRLISMEPLEIQWLQQGQCALLVESIESHWLTKGHINFQNQNINRYMAWLSSMPPDWRPHLCGVNSEDGSYLPPESMGLDPLPLAALPDPHGSYVTLDMKEASDRVSLAHLSLFPRNWSEALMATRSTHTTLPNGVTVELNKFAPMGSAVCFPTEALVFWALAVAAIRYGNPISRKMNYNNKMLELISRRVWVYGDDLIIHSEDYGMVKAALENTGLLLNSNKCCTGRFFRESCGMDAYMGVNVTPLRIKQCLKLDHMTGQQLMSYVSYSNEAYRRGLVELASYLEEVISSVVKIPFTTVDLGHVQFVRPDADVRSLNKQRRIKTRFNRDLYILEAYGPAPRAVLTDDHNVTWESYASRVIESHRSLESMPPITDTFASLRPISGKLKADQYSVPHRVTSNRGWKQITF